MAPGKKFRRRLAAAERRYQKMFGDQPATKQRNKKAKPDQMSLKKHRACGHQHAAPIQPSDRPIKTVAAKIAAPKRSLRELLED